MRESDVYFLIFVMALVTYVIRVIPMAFFSKPIHSRFFKSFLYYVPYAVLAAMTIPGVFMGDLSLAVCSVGVICAVLCAWFGGSLLQVAIAAAAGAWIAGLF
ncbi:AzlD domain-containing protein [Allobaculum mucilyticum]|uniref:AzlD domain-containing protein n=1 Tax=Allobaculum mucilyticum TaxID=2834459 RepID=UPI001E5CA050|nr:AzlD domain-containing protein [Allobaculum mucilyticum]UNT97061.1 AzlD domain-containing protein [Allobaculum mucilyticum]